MAWGAYAWGAGTWGGVQAAPITPSATDLPLVAVQVAFTTNPGDTPVWTTITEDREVLQHLTINRGRSTELDRFQAGRATITLANEDRRFDPTFGPASQYIDFTGVSGNYASTPDTAAISITGDIDIRAKVALDDWTPTAESGLVAKFVSASNYSYSLSVRTDGTLRLYTSSNGSTPVAHISTAPTGIPDGTTKWVRATLDIDNGGGNGTVTFWLSDDGAAWTQLGATVTRTGTAALFDGTAELRVGVLDGTSSPMSGNVFYVEIREGIDGPVKARFDANTVRSTGTRTPTTWQSTTGETWTLNGSAWSWGGSWGSPYYPNVVPMRRIRVLANYGGVTYPVFSGYVDTWEQQYMPPQGAVCVVQATDAFKVLTNAEMLSSPYAETVQGIAAGTGPSFWWRLGEPSGATQAVEAVTGNYPLVPVGNPVFGAAGLVSGDPNGAVQFTDAVSTSASDDGLQGIFPEGSWPFTTAGSIEFVYRYDGTPSALAPVLAVGTLGTDGTPVSGLQTTLADTVFTPSVINAAGTSFQATAAYTFVAGTAVHIVVSWAVGDTVKIYINGVDVTYQTAMVTGTFTNTTSKWIATLNSFDYPPFPQSTGIKATYDEFAIYNRVLSPAEVAAHATAWQNPWSGDKSGARVSRILNFVPWATADRYIDTGVSTLGPAPVGGSALSMLQKIEETEQGALFISADGNVRFIGRDMVLANTKNAQFGDGGPFGYAVALDLPGTSGNYASTPDSAAVSITGDIDIRAKLSMDDWTPAAVQRIVNKEVPSNQRSYGIGINTGGQILIRYSIDGTSAIENGSTVGTGYADGTTHWVRATRASATGTVQFFTSEDGVTWTQLGTTVAGPAGALFDSTSPVEIGIRAAANDPLAGNIYYAEVRNGIGGPVVASFDAALANPTTAQTPTTVTSAQGQVWTINGGSWAWIGNEELEYADLVYTYDDQLIVNDVQVTRENGITQVVGDPTSQTRYLRRSKVFDGMLYATDAEARGLAQWTLTHYKDPLLRATNVRLEPSAGNALTHYPQVLGRELMDRVGVRRRPQNLGSAIDQEVLIEGITHDVTGGGEWRTTWNLSPAETQTYWLLETVGRSELDIAARLGF